MNKIDLPQPAGYDEDFALWSAKQAALLREGRFDQLDIENVAEEIASLGDSQRDEIESRLGVLLLHLLKWNFQPEKRSNSWRATIVEQRNRIRRRILRSPSLKTYPGEVLLDEYESARLYASGETALPLSDFPQNCPYSIEQILDSDFWPG